MIGNKRDDNNELERARKEAVIAQLEVRSLQWPGGPRVVARPSEYVEMLTTRMLLVEDIPFCLKCNIKMK